MLSSIQKWASFVRFSHTIFALPFAAWLTHQSLTTVIVAGVLGGLAIYKHKANIRRLLNGTENRIGGKKKNSAEAQVHAP